MLSYSLLYFLYFSWTYVYRVLGRTFKGSMHVRPEGVRTYVLRVLGRTSIEPLNELEWEWTKPAWNPLILNSFWTGMNGTEGLVTVVPWLWHKCDNTQWYKCDNTQWHKCDNSKWYKCDNRSGTSGTMGNVGLHRWGTWDYIGGLGDRWWRKIHGIMDLGGRWCENGCFFIVIFDDIGGFEAMFWGFWKYLSASRFHN